MPLPGRTDGHEDAVRLIVEMDRVSLSRFRIAGGYARFEPATRIVSWTRGCASEADSGSALATGRTTSCGDLPAPARRF